MNVFEKAIEDIFNIKQFIESFVYQDSTIPCIAIYNENTNTDYTLYGVDDGVNFYLTCKVADFTPKKGMKITFRNTTYRIDTFYADSFNLSYNILLKSLTTKI